MGILDKAKSVGKKTADITVRAGKKGVEVGKKGVDATKHAIRKRTCPECKYYAPVDETSGDCPIGGRRLATSDIATCPQKAFSPYEETHHTEQTSSQYAEQPPQEQQYSNQTQQEQPAQEAVQPGQEEQRNDQPPADKVEQKSEGQGERQGLTQPEQH